MLALKVLIASALVRIGFNWREIVRRDRGVSKPPKKRQNRTMSFEDWIWIIGISFVIYCFAADAIGEESTFIQKILTGIGIVIILLIGGYVLGPVGDYHLSNTR